MKLSQSVAALLALACSAALNLSADPGLKVGDHAPKLQSGGWVQGDAVADFAPDKAYIVEFWATWCGPCKVSIPHLNEIHAKFKDKGLVVIGQDCWERDDELVAPFVKKMGDKMTYRVSMDDKKGSDKGKMAETWMEAAGQNGIPTAFLVDKKGRIAWIGHPMEMKEKTIEDVLAGTFDVDKAATEFAVEQKNKEQLQLVSKEFGMAMQQQKWGDANSKLDEIEKLLPAERRDQLIMPRFAIFVNQKDIPGAYKLATAFSDSHKDNAEVQGALAWQIITDKHIEKPDLAVAEKLAKRATGASSNKNPGIIDTLARVKYLQGKKDEAVTLQTKAVDLATDDMKKALQKTLDSYKKGVLPDAD